ncbi:AAA family ATPase [Chryseobacterium indologenes]|uniref:AAA family ATPase n=1 Tax=Chryseobacterium TaxID=59732 RepID=UPI0003E08240|nr:MULTISPECIES: AAA family ATPase [Chryseobacterium]ASE62930.1 peptidase M41 [Chryseobacterium indologenes]AYZ34162.1 AAA family ATPase [Chryseobacterium indologenes]MBF6642682.1 AAA family ATPase [Chryseobacterium indologenes]MBU3048655.1 AAA family ATPase [Chryseobacterium indologenes]MEB4762727.1 AAA family ATPase [Chryseobacterium indologenes]
MIIDKEEIRKKKKKLDDCKAFLKKEFIGIDKIIDDVMEYIQIWYLMPEILTRPVVINLWGMTGVGKTDLVRKMVRFLEFQNRFVEIELSNSDETSWSKSVSDIFQSNGLSDEKPSIVLFDEIQRFNTIDPDGMPVPQTKFTDFWELLSDGRLSKREREDLEHYLFSYLLRKKENERRKVNGETDLDENPYLNLWDAKELKKYLSMDDDVMSIIDMKEEDMIKLIRKKQKEKKIYEPVNYSKMLIIISGNLDEAFQMSKETSEADIDANIYHAFTKKITVVDIKNALSRKFRPEQVARFGNIHLIYFSLKTEDFQKLIQREINNLKHNTKTKFGVGLKINKNINELIYRNGVFPVQGVRPVFSSVVDILDTNLSKFLFEAIIHDDPSIEINYSHADKIITGKIGDRLIEIPYLGKIDKIRQSNLQDAVANISVHECGHAVSYMLYTGFVPLQLKSKVASSYAAGFTFPHQIHDTKESIVDRIKIYLAGGIAEEIIFGEKNASIGRSHDREQATTLAIDYIRKYGFEENFQATYNLEDYPHRMQQHITDERIENLMQELARKTREDLILHFDLLKNMSKTLSEKGSLQPKEIYDIAIKHQLQVSLKEEGYLHIAGYHHLLNT